MVSELDIERRVNVNVGPSKKWIVKSHISLKEK